MKTLLLLMVLVQASVTEAAVKIPKNRFKAVIALFTQEFQELAQRDNRELEFLTSYEDDWAQSFARRWEKDQVIVYGGMAGLKNGSEDSLAMILCHELGHLYAGEPYMDEHNKLSAEGQSDYWSSSCFNKIANALTDKIPSRKSLSLCGGENLCARALDASLVVTSFYADNRNLSHPQIETPDQSVTPKLIFTHPAPQCRLDTILSGLIQGNRPLCWFKP